MRKAIFIGKVSTWSLAKNACFWHKKSQNSALARKEQALGAWTYALAACEWGRGGARRLNPCARCPNREFWAPGACVCRPVLKTSISSPFLGVCFYVRCSGTWEHNSSLCKVYWGLLNLHSSSSQGLHKS